MTNTVISKDGTKIGYRQMGKGPGLILVPGGMMSSQNFVSLAQHLANDFTVYIPDRRGRGQSDLNGSHFGLSIEADDIRAIIDKTGAQFIFGLSSGAIITLQTALQDPAIKKIAVYEPPIPLKGAKAAAWMEKVKTALAGQNYGKAFTAIVKGTDDPGSFFNKLPDFITGPIMNRTIKADEKKTRKEGDMSLKALIATMPYDIQVVNDSNNMIEECKGLKAKVLLLGGKKSQPYLTQTLDALKAVIPQSKRIEFRKLGHTAADNDGRPELVANELRSFFGTQNG